VRDSWRDCLPKRAKGGVRRNGNLPVAATLGDEVLEHRNKDFHDTVALKLACRAKWMSMEISSENVCGELKMEEKREK
jgi:hypothetical protein